MNFHGNWLKSHDSIQNPSDHGSGLQLHRLHKQFLGYHTNTIFNLTYSHHTHQSHLNAHGLTHACPHHSHHAAHTPTYRRCMFVNERSELGHRCGTMCNGMIRRLLTQLNEPWLMRKFTSPQSTKIQFPYTYMWSQTLLQLLVLHFTYLQSLTTVTYLRN